VASGSFYHVGNRCGVKNSYAWEYIMWQIQSSKIEVVKVENLLIRLMGVISAISKPFTLNM
jgi:hypothetical protein